MAALAASREFIPLFARCQCAGYAEESNVARDIERKQRCGGNKSVKLRLEPVMCARRKKAT